MKIKLYLDAEKIEIKVLNIRNKLLLFYDIIFLYKNFAKVNKNNFKEFINCYRNDKKTLKKKCIKILDTYFVFLNTSSRKATIVINNIKNKKNK